MNKKEIRDLYDAAVQGLVEYYPQLQDRDTVERMWGNIHPGSFSSTQDMYEDIKDQLETQLEQLENMDFWD